MKISKGKKISAICLLLLLAVEATMRLAGFALALPAARWNVIRPEDAGKLRILAVGESTTQDFPAKKGEGAWPRLLEEKLRQAGVDARVYNEARGGTSSPFIVSGIRDAIEHYQPRIVISMMGVNDQGSTLAYEEGPLSRLLSMASRLRTVKLLRWVATAVETELSCKLDMSRIDPRLYSATIENGFKLSEEQPLPEVERRIRESVKDEHVLAQILEQIGVKSLGDLRPGRDTPKARAYFERAFELFPMNHDVAFWEVVGLRTSARCSEVSSRILKCGRNVPDEILSRMADCISDDNGLTDSRAFSSRGLSRVRTVRSLTASHYRTLHEILREKNIAHIAMQYPTLPTQDLMAYFQDKDGKIEESYQDVIFASNRENFEAALRERPYDEIFKDHFRVSWGHSTQLGQQLIAESALKATLGWVKAQN